MPFSDDQFQKLWELVIRIDENTKNQSKEIATHLADDTYRFNLIKQTTDAIDMRIDKLKMDVLDDRASVKNIFDKAVAFQNKLMGAIAVCTFTVPIVVGIVLSVVFKQ